MHPIAAHATAASRVEQLHRDAVAWRRRRGVRVPSIRLVLSPTDRPTTGGIR